MPVDEDVDRRRLKAVIDHVGSALDGADALNLTAIGAKLSEVHELLNGILERCHDRQR